MRCEKRGYRASNAGRTGHSDSLNRAGPFLQILYQMLPGARPATEKDQDDDRLDEPRL